jgi:hypothetical protein
MDPDAHADEPAGERPPFTFAPPPRFVVARQGARFVLSSDEDPGVLLVAPHDAPDEAALAEQLAQGWLEEQVELRPAAPPTRDDDGLLVELRGRFRGTPALAMVRALCAPQGGGVLVVALAGEAFWQPRRYEAYARMIVRSVRWQAPGAGGAPPPPALAELDAWLRGRSLVRMAAGAPGTGGVFAAWGGRQELLLHADGRFESLGLLGAPGRRATGTWRLLAEGDGAVLELLDDDGGVARVAVANSAEGTYLDGARFYVGE